MTTTESQDQCALIKWFDMQYKPLAGRLAAVPNATKVPVWVGARMNREGRRKGFPDLMLLTPRHGFAGLIIELKRIKGGRLGAEQADWLEWLAEQGFLTAVCAGFDSARDTIQTYLREES